MTLISENKVLSAYYNHAFYTFINNECVHSGNYKVNENVAAVAILKALHAMNIKHTCEESIYTDREGTLHEVLEITTEQITTTASTAIPCL